MPYWDHKKADAIAPAFLLCVPSRAYISPCTPEGTGEGIPPHGFAVPFRSAFGLRIPFGSEKGPLVNKTGSESNLVHETALF